MVTATSGFMVGLAFLNGGAAQSIGGLCNGRPASHTWLDASGQPGPAIIEGTRGDDVIIGSYGDDTIDGRSGNDTICGGGGNDDITVGPGGSSFVQVGPGDSNVSTVGKVHSVTEVDSGPGNSTLSVGDTAATSYLYGGRGSGQDTLFHNGSGHVKMDGGPNKMSRCFPEGGDEVVNCYGG
jgi:Ca2+-binding RTX toxin-like protein